MWVKVWTGWCKNRKTGIRMQILILWVSLARDPDSSYLQVCLRMVTHHQKSSSGASLPLLFLFPPLSDTGLQRTGYFTSSSRAYIRSLGRDLPFLMRSWPGVLPPKALDQCFIHQPGPGTSSFASVRSFIHLLLDDLSTFATMERCQRMSCEPVEVNAELGMPSNSTSHLQHINTSLNDRLPSLSS